MAELNIVCVSPDIWELEKGKTTQRQFEWSRDISVLLLCICLEESRNLYAYIEM